MQRLFPLLLVIVLLTVSCEKTPTPAPPFTVSAAEVVLKSASGASLEFTVMATSDWNATTTGDGYALSPRSGNRGTTTVRVTAEDENMERGRTKLGTATFSCAGKTQTLQISQSPATAPQTLMVYMSGTDLLYFFKQNLRNIQKSVDGNILQDSRIMTMIQPRDGEALVLEVYFDAATQHANIDTLQRYTNIVTTEGETMTRLLSDMAALAPAEQYGLQMSSHAGGWVPANYRYLSASEANSGYWDKSGGKITRWFGSDGGVRTDITTLAKSVKDTGLNFEYMIFDACFMSSIEALYDLRNSIKYVVASPCEVMGYGFPYDRFISYLFTNGGTSYNLPGVCQSFYNFYLNDYDSVPGNEQSGCIALTVCAELESLAAVMKRINTGSLKSYDPQTLQIYENLSPHLFYDMGDYVQSICDDPALLEEFSLQFDKTFPSASRLHTPSFYSAYGGGKRLPIAHYSGVSISEPSSKYIPDNQQTEWYRTTH